MEQKSSVSGRVFGVLGILFQIGMLFAYGFASQLYNEGSSVGASVTAANQFLVEYILMVVFALLGFGLLLSFLKYGTWSGMATALMVVSVNIQLGLLIQKFWFNTLLYDFGNTTDLQNSILAANVQNLDSEFARADFIGRQQFVDVMPNVLTYRIALMATISCLVAFLGFIGRIGLFETFLTTISFTVGWNLNYYENINLQINRAPTKVLFDDFGTDNIYLFGSSFALFMMIMLNCKPAKIDSSSYVMNRISGLLGLVGTAFVFATFALTGHIYIDRQNDLTTNFLSLNLESLNNIYALSSSVVGSYIFSALFNKGRVGIREAMLGTVTGGVLIGCVSGFLYNMAIAISVGSFAGLLSAFWFSFLHPKLLNRTNVFDSHGVLGGFWITSLFGGVVFAPSLIQVYANYGFGENLYGADTLFGKTQYNFVQSAAGWQLVYAAISTGIGMAFGLGTGIIMLIMRNYDDDFNDAALFVRGDYGLYVPQKEDINAVQDSAANIKNAE